MRNAQVPHLIALPLFLGLAVFVIAAHNFERYYVTKEFPLYAFTPCDTATHDCFIADPESASFDFQTEPYQKVEIKAAVAPSCLEEHTCGPFTCDGLSGSCEITYCSPDSLEEGESCTSGTP